MMEADLTWNKYRCRMYYDQHKEELLAKRKLAYQKKREAAEPSRPPGRPKRPRPTIKELIAELKKGGEK